MLFCCVASWSVRSVSLSENVITLFASSYWLGLISSCPRLREARMQPVRRNRTAAILARSASKSRDSRNRTLDHAVGCPVVHVGLLWWRRSRPGHTDPPRTQAIRRMEVSESIFAMPLESRVTKIAPTRLGHSRLYSTPVCTPRSVGWSALRYARVETESVPTLHLHCGSTSTGTA